MPGFPFMWFQTKLHKQIKEYIYWKKEKYSFYSAEVDNLLLLKKFRKDINSLTFEDLVNYRKLIRNMEAGNFNYLKTMRDLNGLLKYFRHPFSYKIDINVDHLEVSDTMDTMKRKGTPRFRSLKQAKKVKELHKKGLSYREIGRVMNRNVSLIHRWAKFNPLPK